MGQSRRSADDPGADQGVLVHEPPLLLGQRAAFLQDRIGDRDLADVVQLRGVTHLLDLMLGEREDPRDVDCKLGDIGDVIGKARVSLGDGAQKDVLALTAGRALAPVLLHVHPLVGDPERLEGVLRVLRDRYDPVRARDFEAFTVLAESGGRRRCVLLGWSASWDRTQNSSPPSRYAAAPSRADIASRRPSRARSASPAG